jgi:methyl-CpG-binding domain protein 4
MGIYALDSWRMFCAGEDEWRNVQPTDKELQAWMRWRWAREGITVPEAIQADIDRVE